MVFRVVIRVEFWEDHPTGLEVRMPLYEFRCSDCRKSFPLHLSLADLDRKRYRCPKCKGRKLEKLISSVSIVTSRKS